jgi:hypothetical protein
MLLLLLLLLRQFAALQPAVRYCVGGCHNLPALCQPPQKLPPYTTAAA